MKLVKIDEIWQARPKDKFFCLNEFISLIAMEMKMIMEK